MEADDADDRLVSLLTALISREGGVRNVADASGFSEEYLRQIIRRYPLPSGKPRGVGPRLRNKLAKVYPNWMDFQHPSGGTDSRGSVAHILSHPPQEYAVVPWEAVMQEQPLPVDFLVELPDDSMAPRAYKGNHVHFNTRETPRAGDGVLVRDRDGGLYFRLYRERRAGHWIAQPLHEGYQPLDSEADGLQVVAVMVGIPRQRWADRS